MNEKQLEVHHFEEKPLEIASFMNKKRPAVKEEESDHLALPAMLFMLTCVGAVLMGLQVGMFR